MNRGKRLWVRVQVQNPSIPPEHRRLRKIRPGRQYFTETPEVVTWTPQIQRWLDNGSLVEVDPPPAATVMVDLAPADTLIADDDER
jgi:hypothetical protein